MCVSQVQWQGWQQPWVTIKFPTQLAKKLSKKLLDWTGLWNLDDDYGCFVCSRWCQVWPVVSGQWSAWICLHFFLIIFENFLSTRWVLRDVPALCRSLQSQSTWTAVPPPRAFLEGSEASIQSQQKDILIPGRPTLRSPLRRCGEPSMNSQQSRSELRRHGKKRCVANMCTNPS